MYYTVIRERILDYLIKGNYSTTEIAKYLNKETEQTRIILYKMKKLNLIEIAYSSDNNESIWRIKELGKDLYQRNN